MSNYRRRQKKNQKFGATLTARVDYSNIPYDDVELPEDCILIASEPMDNSSSYKYRALLIDKVNVRGAKVILNVPRDVRHLAIGRNRKNIRKIAESINACYVHIQ